MSLVRLVVIREATTAGCRFVIRSPTYRLYIEFFGLSVSWPIGPLVLLILIIMVMAPGRVGNVEWHRVVSLLNAWLTGPSRFRLLNKFRERLKNGKLLTSVGILREYYYAIFYRPW